jgi:hypothetical protein
MSILSNITDTTPIAVQRSTRLLARGIVRVVNNFVAAIIAQREQPDHPQVLDGLIWAFRTFRVFWSGWYSEPVVVLSGFDGWPVIKGPLYRAGTTPPSIRRSAPVM